MLQAAGKNAFRQNLDAGAGTDTLLKPYAIANGLADLFAQQIRHAGCHRAGRQATGFEHQHSLPAQPRLIEQFKRQNRAFACAGRGLQDHHRLGLQMGFKRG